MGFQYYRLDWMLIPSKLKFRESSSQVFSFSYTSSGNVIKKWTNEVVREYKLYVIKIHKNVSEYKCKITIIIFEILFLERITIIIGAIGNENDAGCSISYSPHKAEKFCWKNISLV